MDRIQFENSHHIRGSYTYLQRQRYHREDGSLTIGEPASQIYSNQQSILADQAIHEEYIEETEALNEKGRADLNNLYLNSQKFKEDYKI